MDARGATSDGRDHPHGYRYTAFCDVYRKWLSARGVVMRQQHKEPLHDGEWSVMRLARSASAEALVDRVVLVEVPGEAFGSQYRRVLRRPSPKG